MTPPRAPVAVATNEATFGEMLKSARVTTVAEKRPSPGKREMSFHRNLAKAESAVKAGTIQPSVRQIRSLCSCGQAAAVSIRAELLKRGVAVADSAGRVMAA